MSIYSERFMFGVWIRADLIPAFKSILADNHTEYIQMATTDERNRVLFQLWLPFDPSFVIPLDMIPCSG